MNTTNRILGFMMIGVMAGAVGCGSDEDDVAYVSIKNDFNNPQMSFQPPWTICESSYMNTDFGPLPLDATSEEKLVKPGLGYVLMVAAWNDPSCAAASALPIASKNEEEVVAGQHRTIAINLANHQGSCPPEGVAPIPEGLYNQILALWPAYGFQPYAQRTQNTECLK
jgi:hypothetical protein